MTIRRRVTLDFLFQAVISVTGFVATLYIARILGAETLGTYAAVVAILFWAEFPVSAVGAAINKRVSEGVRRREFLGAGLTLNGAVALTLAGVVLVAADRINGFISAPVSTLMAALLIGSALFRTIRESLKGQKKVHHSGFIGAVERTGRTAAQVGLVFVGYELSGLVFGHALSLFLATALGLLLFDVQPSLPGISEFRGLISYAKYSWLAGIKTRTFTWLDTLILFAFVETSLVGVYEVAWNLSSVMLLAGASIQRVLFPEMSELATSKGYDEIHEHLEDALSYAGILVIPGMVGTLVVGERVLAIYGEEFRVGVAVLAILVFTQLVASFDTQLLSTINAVDRPDVTFRNNVVFITTNLVLNVVLVITVGWVGAAIASSVSMLVTLMLNYYSLSALIGRPSIPARRYVPQIAAAAIMGVATWAASQIIPEGELWTVVLVLAGAGLYFACLTAFSPRIRATVAAAISG